MARGTVLLTRSMTASAEAMFSRSEYEFTSTPPFLNGFTPTTWFTRDGVRRSYQLILPVGHPDNANPFRIALAYRFADMGQTRDNVTLDTTRGVAGLEGTLGTWDWQSAVLYSQSKRTDGYNNILYFPAPQAAVPNRTHPFS